MSENICRPAGEIIERLGGVQRVAVIVGKDASAIRRWRLARPVGTGGLIPDEAKILLIDHARKVGIALSWADFAPPSLADTS